MAKDQADLHALRFTEEYLGRLDVKYQPADILKEMIDPSAKINEKFQTQIFQLDSGQTITGLVIEETPTLVKLIENPLAKTTPIEIKVAEITARKKSPTSIMPKGLLETLESLSVRSGISRKNGHHGIIRSKRMDGKYS